MTGTSLMPVVAAALVDGEGRVLMQQRPPGKAHAGLWEFPGGKIEPGESPEAALARELLEELDIVVDPSAMAPVAFASVPLDGRHLILLLYSVRAWTGEPSAIEASALQWGMTEDLALLPMPPADVSLLTHLRR